MDQDAKEEVQKFTWEMVDFFLEKEIKLLVIACNTATAFTIEDLKNKLDIPVIGVINPGARAAIKATKNHHIGIIGYRRNGEKWSLSRGFRTYKP